MASESKAALYDDSAALVQQQIFVHKQSPFLDPLLDSAIGGLNEYAAGFRKTSTLLMSEQALKVVKNTLIKVTSGAAALVAKESEYKKVLQEVKNQTTPTLQGLRKDMADFLKETAGELLILDALWLEQAADMVQLLSQAGLPEVSAQFNTTIENITNVFESHLEEIRLVSEHGDFLVTPIDNAARDQAKLLLDNFQEGLLDCAQLLESSKGRLTASMEPFVDRITELSIENQVLVSGWETVPGHVNTTIDNVTAAASSLANIVNMVAGWQ